MIFSPLEGVAFICGCLFHKIVSGYSMVIVRIGGEFPNGCMASSSRLPSAFKDFDKTLPRSPFGVTPIPVSH